jgi:hypothetical protein
MSRRLKRTSLRSSLSVIGELGIPLIGFQINHHRLCPNHLPRCPENPQSISEADGPRIFLRKAMINIQRNIQLLRQNAGDNSDINIWLLFPDSLYGGNAVLIEVIVQGFDEGCRQFVATAFGSSTAVLPVRKRPDFSSRSGIGSSVSWSSAGVIVGLAP